uniref:Uncharacterized protein n=1 Tax=Colobus angolensis palliatus TaxID=336983 RepID=A0A2K5H9U3_COLAP
MGYFCISIHRQHLTASRVLVSSRSRWMQQGILELVVLAMLNALWGGESWAAWRLTCPFTFINIRMTSKHCVSSICQLVWHLFYKGGMK